MLFDVFFVRCGYYYVFFLLLLLLLLFAFISVPLFLLFSSLVVSSASAFWFLKLVEIVQVEVFIFRGVNFLVV